MSGEPRATNRTCRGKKVPKGNSKKKGGTIKGINLKLDSPEGLGTPFKMLKKPMRSLCTERQGEVGRRETVLASAF